MMVVTIGLFPYARAEGMGRAFALFTSTRTVILTGGIHCDGLMDSADGLFSGRERERILEIMKDSRAGSFGVVAMVLVATIEVSALSELAKISTWWLCTAV